MKLEAEEVEKREDVPASVRARVNEFWACDTCDKVFWVGPKSKRAVELMRELRAQTMYVESGYTKIA